MPDDEALRRARRQKMELRRLAEPGIERGDEEIRRGDEEIRRGDEEIRRGDEEIRRGALLHYGGRNRLAADIFQRATDLPVSTTYRASRRLHDAVFARDAPLFGKGERLYRRIEAAPRPVRRLAHALEQAAKVPLFGCKDCGDCSLPEIAYVCPESQCAKNQRNGPCGGTRDGLCEVYDTECIWSDAYERLKAFGEEESMLDGPVVVKDNALQGTSAWANTFLGRDHQALGRSESGEADSLAAS